MLKDLKTAVTETKERDTLGNKSFLWDSGIYSVVIKLVYMDVYPSGAYNINAIFADADGRELTWKLCISNKQKEGFYTRNGKKETHPGLLQANALTDIVTGKELSNLIETPGVIDLYDYDAGKKIPKEKDLFKELHEKRVVIGVIRELGDKSKQDNTGKWNPTGETRESNYIDKFFFADGTTRPEKAEGKPAEFMAKWKEEWEGKIKNTVTKDIAANKEDAAKKPEPRESMFPGKDG